MVARGGDPHTFEKAEGWYINPPADLRQKNDFRDPKIWQEPDGTRIPEKEGAIILFSSPDGFKWKYESILSAMTATFMTDVAAKGISFFADGQVEMDITKYDLFAEE